MDNIFRPLTEAEKTEIVEIGQSNVLELFLARLADKRVEYAKVYKPYDHYSARLEFEDTLRKRVGEIASVVGKDAKNTKIEFPDLEEYGINDRFSLVGTKDVFEDKLLDGIRNSVRTGKEFKYRGKARGNMVTVCVPLLDLAPVEERVNKEYNNKVDTKAKAEKKS